MSLLRIASAYEWLLIRVPSKTNHPSAGLGKFAAKTFQKSKDTGSYYETVQYHDRSFRERTAKMFGYENQKVAMAQLSKYALLVQVQGRRSQRVAKRVGSRKAICVVLARCYGCALTGAIR